MSTATASTRSTHLPTPLTPLIGREREVAKLVDVLSHDDVRLLTLTGPGGVGKTRLAIRVAEVMADAFEEGIWFVPLAPVRDPDLIPSTVAQILGVPETGERSILEGLRALLAPRHALLILDNFEHLLEGGPFVTDLLASCPRLTALVTSRAVLRVSGEHAIAVPPLSLPGRTPTGSGSQDADGPRVDASEAVRLFVARALAADASFALTESNAANVTTLCQWLDGLPLAIELAAARVSSLPLPVLLRRLDQTLRLLTGGPRDQPVRLRTMRDAIAWSNDLLPPEEQLVFRRLGVFVGGFTIEAAEATTASGNSHRETIDCVAALVDKSLVRQELGASGEARYFMLETIRQFAGERLVASGEEEAARQAHAAYYLALAEQADPHLIVPGQEVWLARLESDHDNFRAALAWFEASGAAASYVRLAGALRNLWLLHSHYTEGRRRLERAVAIASPGPPAWRARALAGLSLLVMYQGDHALARRYWTESMGIWRQVGDAAEMARLRLVIGSSAILEGQAGLDHARVETQEALAEFRALGETSLVARPLASMALSNLGDIAGRQGNLAQAGALCTEALGLQRELGYTWGAVMSLARLGDVAHQMGDARRAAAAYSESLELSRSLWDDRFIIWALFGIAHVAAPIQPERAARLIGAVAKWITLTGVTPRATTTLPDRDAAEQLARAGLGEHAFAVAWVAGAALSPQQAIDEALATAAAILAAMATPGPVATCVAGLTPRELEVLRLVAAGHSNREIAELLFVSVSTVKRHLSTIFGKLDLPSRSAATAYAHTHHLA